MDDAHRKQFRVEVAPLLAAQVVGVETLEYCPRPRMSKTNAVRKTADDQHLVLAVAHGEAPRYVNEALAYGLTFQGDRDLHLVLPDYSVEKRSLGPRPVWEASLNRLAHIATPVRLWTYSNGSQPEECVVPPRRTAFEYTRLDESIPLGTHDLGSRRSWIANLFSWADEQDLLHPAHRISYLSYQASGRQVLRISRTSQGLRISAGARRSKRPALEIELTRPIHSDELSQIVAAVEVSIRARETGSDSENSEHRLQARLSQPDGIGELGLAGPPLREVPVTRPGQRRAYIDLLGVDAKGHIHVIETKLRRDRMLALQGLDYWAWAKEHLTEISELLHRRGHRVAGDPKLYLDFVLGTEADGDSDPDLRDLLPQVEAFSGDVTWRIGFVRGWLRRDTATVEIAWFHRRQSPKHSRRDEPQRFARRLERHLAASEFDRGNLRQRLWVRDLAAATVPNARSALQGILDSGSDHDFLAHVRSSQLFAINLFGGLTEKQTTMLIRSLDPTIEWAEAPVLEFSDPADRLREATNESPHTTQADVSTLR